MGRRTGRPGSENGRAYLRTLANRFEQEALQLERGMRGDKPQVVGASPRPAAADPAPMPVKGPPATVAKPPIPSRQSIDLGPLVGAPRKPDEPA
jgi:hypothetical protein